MWIPSPGRRLTVATFGLAGLVGLLASAAPAAGGDRDVGLGRMVGVWQLDSRVSEDPLRMLQRARLAGPPSRPQRRGGDEAEEPGALDLLERRVTAAVRGDSVLTFAYDAPNLRITDWDDHQRVLQVGGKATDVETDGGMARVAAAWKGSDRLVVTTEGAEGKRIDVYELGDRGSTLFVTVELHRKGRQRPFSYDRVYHRVTAAP